MKLEFESMHKRSKIAVIVAVVVIMAGAGAVYHPSLVAFVFEQKLCQSESYKLSILQE